MARKFIERLLGAVVRLLWVSSAICASSAQVADATGQADIGTQVEGPFIYKGICNASAGAALDSDHFVVANDEDNVLRVYRHDTDAWPVQSVDLSAFLQVEPNEPETDLEGAARLGDRIYWITSHGRSKNGKFRPSRHRIFATSGAWQLGKEIRPIGQPYTRLLVDLANDSRFLEFRLPEAAGKEPKSEGGLSIEGLAGTPEGGLLIGFRNPVPGGRALIISLLNPSEVIEGGRARFGEAVRLDLGGLGVRSIDRIGEEYWIVGGASSGKATAQLYVWDGGGGLRKARSLGFEKINPEGLFQFPGVIGVEILSDDGGFKVDGRDCEDWKGGLNKRFRRYRVGE